MGEAERRTVRALARHAPGELGDAARAVLLERGFGDGHADFGIARRHALRLRRSADRADGECGKREARKSGVEIQVPTFGRSPRMMRRYWKMPQLFGTLSYSSLLSSASCRRVRTTAKMSTASLTAAPARSSRLCCDSATDLPWAPCRTTEVSAISMAWRAIGISARSIATCFCSCSLTTWSMQEPTGICAAIHTTVFHSS